MSLNDPLANVLSHILIEDKKGRKTVTIKPSSKIVKDVLDIFNQKNYIGTYSENPDTKGSTLTLNLLGNINKCGVIKPRFNAKADEYEKFEKRYLPAYGFGFLIVSTNKGIMTQEEAVNKKLGGKLIAYVY